MLSTGSTGGTARIAQWPPNVEAPWSLEVRMPPSGARLRIRPICARTRGASPGRSRWALVRSAGSSRRWTSGSRKAGAVPKGLPTELALGTPPRCGNRKSLKLSQPAADSALSSVRETLAHGRGAGRATTLSTDWLGRVWDREPRHPDRVLGLNPVRRTPLNRQCRGLL